MSRTARLVILTGAGISAESTHSEANGALRPTDMLSNPL